MKKYLVQHSTQPTTQVLLLETTSHFSLQPQFFMHTPHFMTQTIKRCLFRGCYKNNNLYYFIKDTVRQTFFFNFKCGGLKNTMTTGNR